MVDLGDGYFGLKSKNGKFKRYAKCKTCNTTFEVVKYCENRKPRYCSSKCYGESLLVKKPCLMCGELIDGNGGSVSNRVYCSKSCQYKSRKGIHLDDDWRKALSEGRKKSEKCKGENLYNWKGGESTRLIRAKTAYYKRKNNLSKDMPAKFLERVLKAQNNNCFYCNSNLKEYKSIEHLTPVSKGGDNDIYNLVYSCKSCNSQKRQLTLEEYAIKTGNLYWLDKFDYIYSSAL